MISGAPSGCRAAVTRSSTATRTADPKASSGDREQLSLIGTSGSRKPTLLHMIASIVPADEGYILYDQRGPGAPPLTFGDDVASTTLDYKATLPDGSSRLQSPL